MVYWINHDFEEDRVKGRFSSLKRIPKNKNYHNFTMMIYSQLSL
jgi:hypothetical protein